MLSDLRSSVMESSWLRPAVHLLSCWLFTVRVIEYSPAKLPLQLFMLAAAYCWSFLLVVWPFQLFVYQPYLSPLRHIPRAPADLNHWKTWLAAEPSPPQLLEWLKSVKHDSRFNGLMRYRGIGGSDRILLCSPPALREVLVAQQYTHFDRPLMARKRIAVQAGTGLIASGGDTHKTQKKMLLPAFGPRQVRGLYPLFWKKAQQLMFALNDHVKDQAGSDSGTVEFGSWASRSALDIIGVAAWGRDFSAISTPSSYFLKSYSAMFDISGGGPFINALALAVPMKYAMQIPCPYNQRLKMALQAIRARCEDTVRERIAVAEKESDNDILSLLIRSGVRDEEALVNQMMTILAAGHDTSSLSLTWAAYLLGKHQDIQKRLHNEVVGSQLPIKPGVELEKGEAQSVQSLKYLQAVTNEILRLYPSVPITRREALKDTVVQEFHIPKGSHMVSCGWLTNRGDEWGSDAEDFDPDRWLKESEKEKDTFDFASFSHGPRACIGQSFARAEFLVFLAALVGCFHIELEDLSEEPKVLYGITMSPAGGVRVRLRTAE